MVRAPHTSYGARRRTFQGFPWTLRFSPWATSESFLRRQHVRRLYKSTYQGRGLSPRTPRLRFEEYFDSLHTETNYRNPAGTVLQAHLKCSPLNPYSWYLILY